MSALPDQSMVDIASQIIDFLGDSMGFLRPIRGVWEESESSVKVYLQARESSCRRSFKGIENSISFSGFAAESADIRNGDRTVINSIYYFVNNLDNRGTHLEFILEQSEEIQET